MSKSEVRPTVPPNSLRLVLIALLAMSVTSMPLASSPLHNRATTYAPQLSEGQFAFARVKGEVCLVQVTGKTPLSAFLPVSLNIFKHEFITIFRLSESTTCHPADVQIIEPIDDSLLRYEEENDTVFLAKGLMEHLRRFSHPSDPRKGRSSPMNHRPSPAYPSQRYRQR